MKINYKYECYIANDNSVGQIVLSGNIEDLEKMMIDLKSANIKNIKLTCERTIPLQVNEQSNTCYERRNCKVKILKKLKILLISNVTGKEIANTEELKEFISSSKLKVEFVGEKVFC